MKSDFTAHVRFHSKAAQSLIKPRLTKTLNSFT